ncbi:hypothetical protein C2845_PM07G09830 [Panicum miliaceum]|uniref:Uncharacterized protein n=1 Tax=Panicum miliaceum TaxID=4540 RepID=A0A3L6SNZ4_PANMI|nr:hypothetical protein C2845_PM07G09830 [Panicum miliaceum]
MLQFHDFRSDGSGATTGAAIVSTARCHTLPQMLSSDEALKYLKNLTDEL